MLLVVGFLHISVFHSLTGVSIQITFVLRYCVLEFSLASCLKAERKLMCSLSQDLLSLEFKYLTYWWSHEVKEPLLSVVHNIPSLVLY